MSEFILCVVSSQKINKDFLNEVSDLIKSSGATIGPTHHLAPEEYVAIDMQLSLKDEKADELKAQLIDLSNRFQIDMALMPNDSSRSDKKLIIFDMDSTLIQQEVIVQMARTFGVGDKVKEITERAMNGKLHFDDALRERIALLKGLPKNKMEQILAGLTLTPGVEKLIQELKKKGYKTAIVSGGFKYFADHFKEKLGMDYVFANDLHWENDSLSGKVIGTIINAEEKARLLEALAHQNNLTLAQVIAVGDGANDIPMLLKAGLGIAFHAKEKVRKEARHHVSHNAMSSILYFLGIRGNHFE